MRQALDHLIVATDRQGLVMITQPVRGWFEAQGITTGLLTLWCRHSSASLLVQENTDPDVQADIETFFRRLVPEAPGRYRHDAEGTDDMPAHIRTMLTQTQICIPVENAQLVLGTWQGIYLYEHRRAGHRRDIVMHLIGE
jgi:secondary thiamine-phosphate synthase enzyme